MSTAALPCAVGPGTAAVACIVVYLTHESTELTDLAAIAAQCAVAKLSQHHLNDRIFLSRQSSHAWKTSPEAPASRPDVVRDLKLAAAWATRMGLLGKEGRYKNRATETGIGILQ